MPKLSTILELAEELSNLGGTIYGSLAWHIHVSPRFPLKFRDYEIDVSFSSNEGILELLEELGYERIEGEEKECIKEALGYGGVEDKYQHFFRKNGVIVDVSTRPTKMESEIREFCGYQIKVITKRELLKAYKRAGRRKDIPTKKRLVYLGMLFLLIASDAFP